MRSLLLLMLLVVGCTRVPEPAQQQPIARDADTQALVIRELVSGARFYAQTNQPAICTFNYVRTGLGEIVSKPGAMLHEFKVPAGTQPGDVAYGCVASCGNGVCENSSVGGAETSFDPSSAQSCPSEHGVQPSRGFGSSRSSGSASVPKPGQRPQTRSASVVSTSGTS